MTENSKKPSLRFKGFTEAWEQRKLENIFNFYTGLTYSPFDITNEEGTLVLRSSNVKDDEIITDDNVFVKSKVVNSENVKVGDIIVVVRNGSRNLIGKHAQIKGKMDKTVIGAFMTGIRTNNSNFAKSLLDTSSFSSQIDKDLGATINQITTGNFKKMEFLIPVNEQEQCKIGLIFNNLDNLITLHQRKYDRLVNIKKGLLEKMFPQNGSSTPEIRFKGFTEAWEQRKLIEIANYRNGRAHENAISDDGKYIVINSKFVSTNGEVAKKSNQQIEPLYKNEIAFVLSDVPNGRAIARTYLVKNNDKYTLNQRIAGITPIENINPYYLYIVLNRNPFFLQFDDGVKQTNLSKDDVTSFTTYYPNKEEQNKIGTIFERIDNLITLHQREQ